jgi:hypothetical protein
MQPIQGLLDAFEQESERADLVPGGPDNANQPPSCPASPSQVREGLCIVSEEHQPHLRDDRVVMRFGQGIGFASAKHADH